MYKCLECGHIFDEGEARSWTESWGESFTGCPCCGGAFERTTYCTNCDGEFLDEELYDGWCIECLTEEIDYDTALKYMLDDGLYMFHLFMFEKVFKMRLPDEVSTEMSNHLQETFRRLKANDLITDSTEFLALIRWYILEDDNDYGRINFAEWLNEERGAK